MMAWRNKAIGVGIEALELESPIAIGQLQDNYWKTKLWSCLSRIVIAEPME